MDPEDLPTNQDLTVIVNIGLFRAQVGTIRITTPLNLLVILVPLFILVIILICVVIVIVLVVIFCKMSKLKKRYNKVVMLKKVESDGNHVTGKGALMEEFIQQLPPQLIIPCNEVRILDISLGQGS